MSAKVDVLAVMNRTASHEVSFLCKIKSSALSDYEASARQARAAVAELIEAADEALVLLEQLDPEHGITMHLRAALAKIGPQS